MTAPEPSITPPKWNCAVGTPDEDHDWERISDWYGDPGVINGTCSFTFLRCRVCDLEKQDDGDFDDYEPDYRNEG